MPRRSVNIKDILRVLVEFNWLLSHKASKLLMSLVKQQGGLVVISGFDCKLLMIVFDHINIYI